MNLDLLDRLETKEPRIPVDADMRNYPGLNKYKHSPRSLPLSSSSLVPAVMFDHGIGDFAEFSPQRRGTQHFYRVAKSEQPPPRLFSIG